MILTKNHINMYPHSLAETAIEKGYISREEVDALADETGQASPEVVANHIIDTMANGRPVPFDDRVALVCVLLDFKKSELNAEYLKVRAMIRHELTAYEQMLQWLTPSGTRGPYVQNTSPWVYRMLRDECNIAAEMILASLGIHGESQTQLIALPVASASIRMEHSSLIVTTHDGDRVWIHVSHIARFQRMRLYEHLGREGDLGVRVVWLNTAESIERKPHILAQAITVSRDDDELKAQLDAMAYCN
jgi:hypothetical protein